MRRSALALGSTLSLVALTFAQATGPDFSGVSVNLSGVWGLAGTIVGALATMIVVRKGIKLVNRS